nr:MAG TPA: hypothetical protein [Caudoviricetes sp.]
MFANGNFKMTSYSQTASMEERMNVLRHIHVAETKGVQIFNETVGNDPYGRKNSLRIFVSENQVCFVFDGNNCSIVECIARGGHVLGALENYLAQDRNKLAHIQQIIPLIFS